MRLTAASRRGALTPALPMPYPMLESAGLRLRRGQLSLVVAGPGVGKTQLLHNIAHRAGVPALYWSADTDQHEVAMRAMALWTGRETQAVEAHQSDSTWNEHYAEALAHAGHIDWIFDPAITGRVVVERTSAFAEVHGEFPRLIVIDNLSNAVTDQTQELAEQKDFMVQAQRLARATKAHVSVLAHAKGIYDTGDKAIPLGGVLNNLGKLPEIVLTLYRANEDGTLLGVNVVKNRGGIADPAAKHPINLRVDFGTATVKGFR